MQSIPRLIAHVNYQLSRATINQQFKMILIKYNNEIITTIFIYEETKKEENSKSRKFHP